MSDWVYLLAWAVAGIGTAGACAVWYVAQTPGRIDLIDSVFITMLGLVVVALWPIVLVAVANLHLLRRLQAVEVSSPDSIE